MIVRVRVRVSVRVSVRIRVSARVKVRVRVRVRLRGAHAVQELCGERLASERVRVAEQEAQVAAEDGPVVPGTWGSG